MHERSVRRRNRSLSNCFHSMLVSLLIAALLASSSIVASNSLRASAARLQETTDEFWRDVDESSINGNRRRSVSPNSYRTVRLKNRVFKRAIKQAPNELTAAADAAETQITLPTPEGGFSRFRVQESPIMDDALAARLPDMKTYQGQGIDDPTVTTRFDWSPAGLHAIVLSSKGIILIAPYASGNNRNYIVYYTSESAEDVIQNQCLLSREEITAAREREGIQPQSDVTTNVVNGTLLRTYRLAVASTAEFTQQYGGGNVAQAQTAVAQNVNLVSAIYRRELSISFTLINNSSIIFTDPATDGYTNSNPGTMLNENQAKLDSVIGSANYDIGHVFGAITGLPSGARSFSGIAGLRVACVAGQKGRGATVMGGGSTAENIFVNGVAHEFGHQLGATHTFNATSGSCSSSRTQASAWEPGSGSTLMAYSICGDENLQPTIDQYFHTGSLEQVVSYVTGAGNCAAQSQTGNLPPTVEAGPNFTIPSRTPFELTASANDPNGDAVTYAWEEFDTGAASPPNTDDGTRPIFRSYPPAPSPSRMFPSLKYILNNDNNPPQTYTLSGRTFTTGEALPVTNRTMAFRATVRDNRAAGGAVQSDQMQVSVVASAGPFKVTQPDAAISWPGGSIQNVTWNVAGTASAPINTTAVRITLSTDGGNSFPIVLADSTSNDGLEPVVVPNVQTSTARVKVQAVGNIFFDISNVSFTIAQGAGAAGNADTIGAYNPAMATFFLRNSNSAGSPDAAFVYGPAGLGWTPVIGDWNGDGVDTVGLYDPVLSSFFLRNANSGGAADLVFSYGPAAAGWRPVTGDWNGDGVDTVGLYNPATSTFFLKNTNSTGAADIVFTYGPAASGWVPLAGDWDGNGTDTVGLFNPATSTFFLRNANSAGVANIVFSYGPPAAAWLPIDGDWNGDRVDTIGLYNPATAGFFLRNANSAGAADITFVFGQAGLIPIVGNWDGR